MPIVARAVDDSGVTLGYRDADSLQELRLLFAWQCVRPSLNPHWQPRPPSHAASRRRMMRVPQASHRLRPWCMQVRSAGWHLVVSWRLLLLVLQAQSADPGHYLASAVLEAGRGPRARPGAAGFASVRRMPLCTAAPPRPFGPSSLQAVPPAAAGPGGTGTEASSLPPRTAFQCVFPVWHHQQRSSPAPRSSVASRRTRGRAVAGRGRKDGQADGRMGDDRGTPVWGACAEHARLKLYDNDN